MTKRVSDGSSPSGRFGPYLRLLLQENIERLRQAWDDGKASGDAGPLDFDELRRKARRRLAKAAARGDGR